MKIEEGHNYFLFTLDDDDFDKYSYDRILNFIDALKRNIPIHARHYIEGERHWQIQNDYRRYFEEAVARHLSGQRKLF